MLQHDKPELAAGSISGTTPAWGTDTVPVGTGDGVIGTWCSCHSTGAVP
jgi:hypothetical protein